MSRLVSTLLLLFSLSSYAIVAAQNSLAFTFPPSAAASKKVTFPAGQNVGVKWTSTWELNTLQMFQGNGQGIMQHINLLTNVSNATTSYVWSAHNLQGLSSSNAIHLYLINAENPDCNNCHANTSSIFVQDSNKKSQKELKLGLGLGLGLGIPLVIAVTAILTWLCVRRRRSDKVEQSQEKDEAPPPSSAGGYTLKSPDQPGLRQEYKPPVEAGGQAVHELHGPQGVPLVEAPSRHHVVELDADPSGKRGRYQ